MIKAIDTYYNNNYFRSRLEARWAVYFDALKTKWEYEQEGYDLGEEGWYLPDFYLPEHKIYAEIKPIEFTLEEHLKCYKLAVLSGKSVIELVGLPTTAPMDVNAPPLPYEWETRTETIITKASLLLLHPKENWIPFYYAFDDCFTDDEIIQTAILKAKCTRFEHGQRLTKQNHKLSSLEKIRQQIKFEDAIRGF